MEEGSSAGEPVQSKALSPGPASPNDDCARAQASHRARVLAAACVCQLMVVLDISVVNVALPRIDHALAFSPASLSWVVNAYTLAFAGLLLLGARVADLVGHRRTMTSALVFFGIASMLGGLAHTPTQLIAARAAQGAAAAVLAPVTLVVIMATFEEGAPRRRAIATWGMVQASGSAVGVLLSGVLTEYLNWRWVLYVNIPFVVAGLVLALGSVRNLSSRTRTELDVPGAVLATASMTLLAYGCVNAGEHGWADGTTAGSLALAVITFGAFLATERRARHPLVRLQVIKSRSVAIASVLMTFVGGATVTSFYFASLFLQNVLGYSPVRTGLAFLPFSVGIALATMASSVMVERLGPRRLITSGLVLAGVGFILFARLDVDSGLGTFLLPVAPASLGIGATIAPILNLGTSGADRHEAGMVSGLLNTSRQAGGSVALALLVTMATRVTARSSPSGLHALAQGYRVAFVLDAVLLLSGAVVSGTILRPRR
ncbi:MAG: MFS transporter [Nocardioides sp.]